MIVGGKNMEIEDNTERELLEVADYLDAHPEQFYTDPEDDDLRVYDEYYEALPDFMKAYLKNLEVIRERKRRILELSEKMGLN